MGGAGPSRGNTVPAEPLALLTFGHGRLARAEFSALVTGAGIERVVDVRRFPGSRANSDSARGQIPATLAAAGVDYRWDERLGGRRRLTKAQDEESPDTCWTVEAFRAYAGWTRGADFRAALPDLVADCTEKRTAIMCSEAVWWRCHRRLIADVMTLELGADVHDLMHDGAKIAHRISDGARIGPDGWVIWDGPGRPEPMT